MSKAEQVIREAEAHMGCPYVYGTWGQKCTPALRKRYAGYNPSQREITYKRCPVLSEKQQTCTGCKYDGMLAFDCRGFTHWCLDQVGIDITGSYVGRQWSDKNWAEKGEIGNMPNLVCCIFIKKSDGNWSHTGLHIGNGDVIHCSGEVKRDRIGGERSWNYYAIPKGLYTDEEIRKAHEGRPIMRTLKRGMTGDDVRRLQEALNAVGFDCGTADGNYGKNTEMAVRKFQSANGIVADGIAGPVTLSLLGLKDADAPELPEDDDRHDTPSTLVLTYANALIVRDELKKALKIIEDALQ